MNEIMQDPQISVIMPVYNGEAYLSQAIESVLKQTFQDFELIIINDGSTDASERIIKSFHDDRIRYVQNDSNLKLIATLNKGVGLARGKYIARMDADDVSCPERLKIQLDYLEKHTDVGLCGTWAYVIDGNGNRTGRIKNPGNQDMVSCSLLFTCPLIHPSVMGRTSLFRAFEYDASAHHVEDFELWNRMTRNGVKVANVCRYLIEYRWHESNISVFNAGIQYDAKCRILKPQVSELLGRPVSDDEMNIHELSFQFYKNGHKSIVDFDKNLLSREKKWLIGISEANHQKLTYRPSKMDALLLSRWAVTCIAFGRYLDAFSLPGRFYRPSVLAGAFILMLQK